MAGPARGPGLPVVGPRRRRAATAGSPATPPRRTRSSPARPRPGRRSAADLAAARRGLGQGPGPAQRPAARATRSRCPRASGRSRSQTTWVEPAYLEPDASWCRPGGGPGVAARQRRRVRGQAPFAGRPDEARELADANGRGGARAVDPRGGGAPGPEAAARRRRASRADGTGVLRVARPEGSPTSRRFGPRSPRPRPGSSSRRSGRRARPSAPSCGRPVGPRRPSLMAALRGPGGRAGAGGPVEVAGRDGGRAGVSLGDGVGSRSRYGPARCSTRRPCAPTASVRCTRRSGWVLERGDRGGRRRRGAGSDDALLRHPVGPRHARGRRDGASVDDRFPVNGSDAVFAATAAAAWLADGLAPRWPTRRSRTMSRPVGPYSPFLRAGGWVVTSGQIGIVAGRRRARAGRRAGPDGRAPPGARQRGRGAGRRRGRRCPTW